MTSCFCYGVYIVNQSMISTLQQYQPRTESQVKPSSSLKFIPLYFFKKSTTGQGKVSQRYKTGIIRLSLG
jgi:hypothetical protein